MSQMLVGLSAQDQLEGALLHQPPASGRLGWFARGIAQVLRAHGHTVLPDGTGVPRLVVNFIDSRRPRPFRRKAQGTFVVSVVEVDEEPADVLKAAYPLLVRSLSNLLIYAVAGPGQAWRAYFVTLEQGCFLIPNGDGGEPAPVDDETYFRAVFERLEPLANSQLVVNNIFHHDLPPECWQDNPRVLALSEAGRRLDAMHLLPAPFPLTELLGKRDLMHVKRLFGVGGLSYGNLSVREDAASFWMSASGIDKGNLQEVGRDMLLVTDYDPVRRAMHLRVPPGVTPRRVSVDAIEHWMIYREHPTVGAIIHVHAWMEGVPRTTVNYPCGTAELAKEVADLVRRQEDPARAVIGLKNHGLTITGYSLEDIFERIAGRLLPQVPMS